MNPSTGTQIIGHSGSGGHGPPSSAASIQAALEKGATAIQVDVQFAADSTPVVFHDRTLERSAGVNGTIRNQDTRELGGYDTGFRFGDRFRGTRLLTVEEAAGLIPETVDIHLDIKDFDTVNAKHLRGLLAVLKRVGGLDRCLITSTSESVLAAVGSTDRSVRRGLRTHSARSESVGRATSLGCGSLHPEAGSTRRALVEACRESGILIIPHSAEDGRAMRNMIDLGVDGITTGNPERLAEISRGSRSSPRASRRPGAASPPPRTAPPETDAPDQEPGRQTPAADAKAPLVPPIPAREDSLRHAEESEAAPEGEPDKAPGGEKKTAQGKRRRRGRRGGKREQARRARRTGSGRSTESTAPGDAEVIPLEPVEEESEPLELLGEIHAELDRQTTGEGAQPGSGDGRKRRRRGRRGGKRVQARRQKKKPSGSASS